MTSFSENQPLFDTQANKLLAARAAGDRPTNEEADEERRVNIVLARQAAERKAPREEAALPPAVKEPSELTGEEFYERFRTDPESLGLNPRNPLFASSPPVKKEAVQPQLKQKPPATMAPFPGTRSGGTLVDEPPKPFNPAIDFNKDPQLPVGEFAKQFEEDPESLGLPPKQ